MTIAETAFGPQARSPKDRRPPPRRPTSRAEAGQVQDEIEACGSALDLMCTAICTNHADKWAQWGRERLRKDHGLRAAQSKRAGFYGLATDPVGISLQEGVRRIGLELYDICGGTALLHQMREEVAGYYGVETLQRLRIMASAWDGIGQGKDRFRARPGAGGF